MPGQNPKPSAIALDECYAAGDDAFLLELRRFFNPNKLIAVAEKWKVDPRPWATRMLRDYLDQPLSCPGHEPLVKRLFKHAEAEGDDQRMGWFLLAFDRMVRRKRMMRSRYDYQARHYYQVESLRARSNTLQRGGGPEQHKDLRLFSHRTRHYLRRRVWRYFRQLAHRDEARYRTAILAALRLYQDKDLSSGENIIDNWSLMHACYFESPVIRFGPSLVHLVDGQSLQNLDSAPYRPEVWRQPEAFQQLIELAGAADSSLVRQWAVELLKREHADASAQLELEALLPLLTHRDPTVQEFAASLFASLTTLGSVPLSSWLALLETDNLTVLTMLCQAMEAHVAPDRFSREELIELSTKVAVPVARMGFTLVQQRHEQTPLTSAEISQLAHARCDALAGSITTWALERIGTAEHYDVDLITPFFDALQATGRKSALNWLQPGTPGWDDPRLWARLIETPFTDVRDALINRLELRIQRPSPDPEQLTNLWCTVILGVHRGGRQKPKAVRQIVQAVQKRPARAEQLAPVLAIAVRSIRGPEKRAGLAAVAELVTTCPALYPTLAGLLPEMQIQGAPACN